MARSPRSPVDSAVFASLAAAYRKRWPVRLIVCDVDGRCRLSRPAERPNKSDDGSNESHRLAVEEALRWGDPAVVPAPSRRLIWAVPLMHNQRQLGGLIASISEKRAFAGDLDIRRACSELRLAAEQHNLTNAALLAANRADYFKERHRAETIHDLKQDDHYDIRRMYLLEEPALIAAVRRGDRGEARNILNRLLVAILHRAGDRLDLVKSFFMELIVTMTRTAVEAGGAPDELLGQNFRSLTELAEITDEEQLAPWLTRMLEQLMDSLGTHRHRTDHALLAGAIRFMADHYAENITRDTVAEVACVSPSHFSRLIRKQFGRSFVDLLNQMRVDRAAELLARTDRPLAVIALETGFRDQSYFTKVFRRYRDITPLRYRESHQG